MKVYRDHYFLKAKRENYPARSVYKLQELDEKFHLLKPGMKVLDLGAAPGSWSLFAAKKVGPGKRVPPEKSKDVEKFGTEKYAPLKIKNRSLAPISQAPMYGQRITPELLLRPG